MEEETKIIELPRKPFRCLKCGISFGETDGIRLYCGEYAIFTLKVTPTCAQCGEPRTWRPVALMRDRHYYTTISAEHAYAAPTVTTTAFIPEETPKNDPK